MRRLLTIWMLMLALTTAAQDTLGVVQDTLTAAQPE